MEETGDSKYIKEAELFRHEVQNAPHVQKMLRTVKKKNPDSAFFQSLPRPLQRMEQYVYSWMFWATPPRVSPLGPPSSPKIPGYILCDWQHRQLPLKTQTDTESQGMS